MENYQDKMIFNINDNEVKMGSKDVMLISGLKVLKINFKQTEAKYPTFGIDISLKLKKLHTEKSINLLWE